MKYEPLYCDNCQQVTRQRIISDGRGALAWCTDCHHVTELPALPPPEEANRPVPDEGPHRLPLALGLL